MKSVISLMVLCALGFSILVNLIGYVALFTERKARLKDVSLATYLLQRQRIEITILKSRANGCGEVTELPKSQPERI